MTAMAQAMMKAGLANEKTMVEIKKRDEAAQKERDRINAEAKRLDAAIERLPDNIRREVMQWVWVHVDSNNPQPIPLKVLEAWAELGKPDAVREWSKWLFVSREVRLGA